LADNAAADVVRDPPRALISGSRTVIWLLVAPLVVGLAVFAVYPFIDVLALSFSKSSLGRPFQKWPVAANYLALARDETFRAALVRTMIFAIPVPLIEVTLGFSVALLLHSSLRGAGWIRGVILLPLMTPPSNILWHITLPILAPTLLAILLLRVVIAFKLFDLVYGLTFGGPGFDTTVAAFQVWRTALAQFDIGLASAQTIIFAILVSLVTLPLTWLHRYSEAHAG
jgi:ABC-type sugar transport system permease subunit